MSAPEKFLDRWSRRKHEAADETAPAEAKDAATAPPLSTDGETKEVAAEVPFDPASLPPIESITAESDIRTFLKPGVPPELTRAALRRAWSADPAIRDFIGLVENGWDFNDPHGVPGFGPMPVDENIARLLAQAIGAPTPAETDALQQVALAQGDSEQNPPSPTSSEPAQQLPQDQLMPNQELAVEKHSVQRNEEDIAMQNNSDDRESLPPSRPRGHGGALPK